MTDDKVLKICDFGLAKDCHKYEQYTKKSDVRGRIGVVMRGVVMRRRGGGVGWLRGGYGGYGG